MDIILSFDLLSLIETDTQLKRSGAWWIGPCPFCGGVDRFNLHQTNDGWRWFCRGCGDGRYHDEAAYIMKRENLSYLEALQRMGAEKPDFNQHEKRTADLRQASEERQPTGIWRQRA